MIIDTIASTHLGKKSKESQNYDPSFLVAVPREENRTQYSIDNKNLPFEGFDIWHAYEFSCMTENGLPVTKVLKIKYHCESEFIIESKSLKLYFNSFNMSKFGKNIDECLEICKKLIKKDLSEKLKTDVEINFLNDNSKKCEIFKDFKNLLEYINENDIKIEEFKESPKLLQTQQSKNNKYFLKFESLRSNCRVTHQPDFGDIFIYYKSDLHIKEDSLIKYLVSFRSEFHFHEECCEMIYKRLFDILDRNDELLVCAIYTRRGGIDITPVRWSKNCSIIDDVFYLLDLKNFARCGIKQ